MDLLDSILSKMSKPPTVSNERKKLMQKEKEQYELQQKRSREDNINFRKYVENKVESFVHGESFSYAFSPMGRLQISILQDVAETAGLQIYCFGEDEVDRYGIVYRKEFGPSEEELTARRAGQPWNDKVAADCAAKKSKLSAEASTSESDMTMKRCKRKIADELSGTHYKAKYAHLIGETAALDAARKTTTNKNYGEVPSENKKDQRSIEQTMADILAKRQKKTKDNLKIDTRESDPDEEKPDYLNGTN